MLIVIYVPQTLIYAPIVKPQTTGVNFVPYGRSLPSLSVSLVTLSWHLTLKVLAVLTITPSWPCQTLLKQHIKMVFRSIFTKASYIQHHVKLCTAKHHLNGLQVSIHKIVISTINVMSNRPYHKANLANMFDMYTNIKWAKICIYKSIKKVPQCWTLTKTFSYTNDACKFFIQYSPGYVFRQFLCYI